MIPQPDLVVATTDVPNDVSCTQISHGSLPTTWRETPAPAELAAIDDRFARTRREAILTVPSALAPEESNWLLNPDHPDFKRVRVRPSESFAYDARLLA